MPSRAKDVFALAVLAESFTLDITDNYEGQPIAPSHDGDIHGQTCSLRPETFVHHIGLDSARIYVEASNGLNSVGRRRLLGSVLAVEMRHHQGG
jgi:hypothetical protein